MPILLYVHMYGNNDHISNTILGCERQQKIRYVPQFVVWRTSIAKDNSQVVVNACDQLRINPCERIELWKDTFPSWTQCLVRPAAQTWYLHKKKVLLRPRKAMVLLDQPMLMISRVHTYLNFAIIFCFTLLNISDHQFTPMEKEETWKRVSKRPIVTWIQIQPIELHLLIDRVPSSFYCSGSFGVGSTFPVQLVRHYLDKKSWLAILVVWAAQITALALLLKHCHDRVQDMYCYSYIPHQV